MALARSSHGLPPASPEAELENGIPGYPTRLYFFPGKDTLVPGACKVTHESAGENNLHVIALKSMIEIT
eukprot:3939170-Rhodomonas_salina.5